MTWQLLLMDANAIVCLLIMVRLMFFRKEGKRHRLSVAVLAYLVILAAGFNAF
ncbi:phage holin family protein, partial [Enterobacter hormaechei]|nr:phage holin family protein [Enterobacter hormaechei]ELP0658181.1 phage holin family protein [Enterobacter hormaechei]ELW9420289.1 phage holin family protein [Enterobacter hormaechei]